MIIRNSGVKTCAGEDAELIFPPHPDLDEYPGWLREKALERMPELRDAWPNSGSDAISRWIREIGNQDWMDHWGTAIYAGKEYLISEPYDMNREKIDELVRFCDALNLAFTIQASGHHYPSQTMRILVWPKEWRHSDEFLAHEEEYEVRAKFLAESEWARECQARAAESMRLYSSNQVATRSTDDDDERNSGFILEEHLRDYLSHNLHLLEEGLTLWPVGEGLSAVEFSLSGKRKIDILARDSSGVPTVVELKVSRGHEKTVGQVLLYRKRVKELFKAEKVRVIIVAKQITHELKDATDEVRDLTLFEYSVSMTVKRV